MKTQKLSSPQRKMFQALTAKPQLIESFELARNFQTACSLQRLGLAVVCPRNIYVSLVPAWVDMEKLEDQLCLLRKQGDYCEKEEQNIEKALDNIYNLFHHVII